MIESLTRAIDYVFVVSSVQVIMPKECRKWLSLLPPSETGTKIDVRVYVFCPLPLPGHSQLPGLLNKLSCFVLCWFLNAWYFPRIRN